MSCLEHHLHALHVTSPAGVEYALKAGLAVDGIKIITACGDKTPAADVSPVITVENLGERPLRPEIVLGRLCDPASWGLLGALSSELLGQLCAPAFGGH